MPEEDLDSDGTEDEENVGAFTVANLNDTNGDGYPDNDDTHRPVTKNGNLGRDEQYLMKLTLWKPCHDMGGSVRLTVVSGNVKFWPDETKSGGEITDLEIPVSTFSGDSLTWWVEAREPTTELQGIKLKYEYRPEGAADYLGAHDVVTATAIWVASSEDYHVYGIPALETLTDNLSYNQVLARMPQDFSGGTDSDAAFEFLKEWKNQNCDSDEDDVVGSLVGKHTVNNGVIVSFRVIPHNIAELPDEYFVDFDIGQQVQTRGYFVSGRNPTLLYPGSGPAVMAQEDEKARHHFPNEVDRDNEISNDERVPDTTQPWNYSESWYPTLEGGHMWFVDHPGFSWGPRSEDGDIVFIGRMRARTFVRVAFGTDAGLAGSPLAGSRASTMVPWHHDITVFNKDDYHGTDSGAIGRGEVPFHNEICTATIFGEDGLIDANSLGYSSRQVALTVGLVLADQLGADDPRFLVDLRDDDFIAGFDMLDSAPSTHAVQYSLWGEQPTQDGRSEPVLGSDPVLFAAAYRIGTGVDAEVRGAGGGSGDGGAGNPAYLEFALHASGVIRSEYCVVNGTVYDLPEPVVPSPLKLGANDVEVDGLYVEAWFNGVVDQPCTLRLYEKDPGIDDLLAEEVGTAMGGPIAIAGCAEPVDVVVFAVSNANGTVSGNSGSNEPNETPLALLYQCDPGTGMTNSPVVQVSVEQP
ncbi:MAG: hypothetical protein ACYTKD_25575 [Planctomycetota bacterium]